MPSVVYLLVYLLCVMYACYVWLTHVATVDARLWLHGYNTSHFRAPLPNLEVKVAGHGPANSPMLSTVLLSKNTGNSTDSRWNKLMSCLEKYSSNSHYFQVSWQSPRSTGSCVYNLSNGMSNSRKDDVIAKAWKEVGHIEYAFSERNWVL